VGSGSGPEVEGVGYSVGSVYGEGLRLIGSRKQAEGEMKRRARSGEQIQGGNSKYGRTGQEREQFFVVSNHTREQSAMMG
jgi:hypothetical protein